LAPLDRRWLDLLDGFVPFGGLAAGLVLCHAENSGCDANG
jgi:hypothetical protein